MPALIDLTNRRFGELTVIGRSSVSVRSRRKWICRCDCGAIKEVLASSLSCGDVTTCGAHRSKDFVRNLSRPNPSKRKYPEGADTKSRLWTIFRSMHMRCEKPSHCAFPRYGGRGITICKEWSHNFAGFSEWALANGYSDGLTLDRIDNDKGYEPANCRWATMMQQGRNTRSNLMLTAFGETKCQEDWLDDPRCTATRGQFTKRVAVGYDPQYAMTATEHQVRSEASKKREAIRRGV